jgi:hypothetical protein
VAPQPRSLASSDVGTAGRPRSRPIEEINRRYLACAGDGGDRRRERDSAAVDRTGRGASAIMISSRDVSIAGTGADGHPTAARAQTPLARKRRVPGRRVEWRCESDLTSDSTAPLLLLMIIPVDRCTGTAERRDTRVASDGPRGTTGTPPCDVVLRLRVCVPSAPVLAAGWSVEWRERGIRRALGGVAGVAAASLSSL